MKLSKILGMAIHFFRLPDCLTHIIFDGREWKIYTWQTKTYKPIKKQPKFSCLPPFSPNMLLSHTQQPEWRLNV